MRIRGPGGFIPAFGGPPFRGFNPRFVPAYKYARNHWASYKMPLVKSESRNTFNAFKLRNRGIFKRSASKIQALFRGRRLRKFLFNK